jgi:hypothetical protein
MSFGSKVSSLRKFSNDLAYKFKNPLIISIPDALKVSHISHLDPEVSVFLGIFLEETEY